MGEEDSARLVRRAAVEMQSFEDDGKASSKNASLSKGRSLPKPSIAREYSFQKILKTLSLSPYELQNWQYDKDIENGHI